MYRVSLKKGTLAIFILFLFLNSDFDFSHVFWNENFEPVSFSQSNHIHSESKLPQQRKNACADLILIPALEVKLELEMQTLSRFHAPCRLKFPKHHWLFSFQFQFSDLIKMADIGYGFVMHFTIMEENYTFMEERSTFMEKHSRNHVTSCFFLRFQCSSYYESV